VHDKGQIVIRQHPVVTRLEAVLKFSRVQICSEIFKPASHKEKNAETQHLDASLGVINLLLK
jgi:hypothetical protein